MNPLTLVKRIQNINSKEASLGISEDASWHAKYKDSAYVFVGGIPFDLTEGDLLAVFAQYGEIVDVNLVRDKGTGKSKGFAFIAYEDQRSTILAVDNLNGAQILGRTIRVDHVTNYKKKEEEDKEEEQRKREERGVCRAFQKGECTRGAGCKFSHDEQRAANTGWGAEDQKGRWGNDRFERKVEAPRPQGHNNNNNNRGDEKQSRQHGGGDDYEEKPRSRENIDSKGGRRRRMLDEREDSSRGGGGGYERREMSRRYDEGRHKVREDGDRSRGEEKRSGTSAAEAEGDEGRPRDMRREERRSREGGRDLMRGGQRSSKQEPDEPYSTKGDDEEEYRRRRRRR